MIPKIIHYCWFGRNPKPKLAEKYIKSWRKYCPDYEIIEWNEDNFDISACPLYVRQAYDAKKWAFVTDYVRLKVVYEHGGIYLDTDVELIKNLDVFLENNAFFGFEDGVYVATGLGFGAKKNAPILLELMADYRDIPFVLSDGSYDTTTCPIRNTNVLLRHGLKQNNAYQHLDAFTVFPKEYFCPIDLNNHRKRIKAETISIHHFSASWVDTETRQIVKKRKRKERLFRLTHIPNRLLMRFLGAERYSDLKKIVKSLFDCRRDM